MASFHPSPNASATIDFTRFEPPTGTAPLPAGPLGPFTALERSTSRILGHGFDGRLGRFGYVVQVLVVGEDWIELETSQQIAGPRAVT